MAVSLCAPGEGHGLAAADRFRTRPRPLHREEFDEEAQAPASRESLSVPEPEEVFARHISATPATRGAPSSPASPPLSPQLAGAGGRLVDCSWVGPTCRDAPDAPRFEFEEFRRRAAQLAQEFFCSKDCVGMIASVKALGCEDFHDELAAALLRASMDRKGPERQAVVTLLGALSGEGLLSGSQLARGFEKLVLGWDDLQLDVPDAPGQLAALLSDRVGLLDRHLLARLPEGLLRRLAGALPESLRPSSPAAAAAGAAASSARSALEAHLEELVAFKRALERRLEVDLFSHHSAKSMATWLRATNKPVLHHEVVLAACTLAMRAEGGLLFAEPDAMAERQRLALSLLTLLSSTEENALISEVDIQLGFSRLLGELSKVGNVDESKLQQEHAVALLRSAVEHEILPAEFLKSARRLRFGGLVGVEVVRAVQRQTPMHSRRIWGSGDARQFRREVREAILEYFDSGSTHELGRIVEELHLSEVEQARFMRKLMVTGMERATPDAALDAVDGLLGRCWTLDEVRLAFEQLRDVAQDLVLDFPQCRERTTDLVRRAAARGLLESEDLLLDGATIV